MCVYVSKREREREREREHRVCVSVSVSVYVSVCLCVRWGADLDVSRVGLLALELAHALALRLSLLEKGLCLQQRKSARG